MGKTQFSIAYTLCNPELTLIFAEPESLTEDLEQLIAEMERKRSDAPFCGMTVCVI